MSCGSSAASSDSQVGTGFATVKVDKRKSTGPVWAVISQMRSIRENWPLLRLKR